MLAVLYTTNCTHSYREDRTWGDWSEEYDFTIDGVEHVLDGDDEPMSHKYSHEKFDIVGQPGEMVYVLFMRYSAGDSFGRASGNGDVLMVYTDRAMAKEALALFQEATSGYKDPQTVSIPVEGPAGRKMFDCPNAGWGFFETVESAELHGCMIV